MKMIKDGKFFYLGPISNEQYQIFRSTKGHDMYARRIDNEWHFWIDEKTALPYLNDEYRNENKTQ